MDLEPEPRQGPKPPCGFFAFYPLVAFNTTGRWFRGFSIQIRENQSVKAIARSSRFVHV
jgi:hypothetical protein